MDCVVNVSVRPCATLSLHVGGVLAEAFPLQIGILSLCRFRQNAQIDGISGIDLGSPSIEFFVV